MLIGEYIHTIDEKNRVSVPFKFRKELGHKIIITPGLENCLFVFKESEWKKVATGLLSGNSELSFLDADRRNFNRYILGRAIEAEVDKVGRILVPDNLKKRIGAKNSVAIIGLEDRLEIWSEEEWMEGRKQVEKDAVRLAQNLSVKK